jgi:hypothetical protein
MTMRLVLDAGTDDGALQRAYAGAAINHPETQMNGFAVSSWTADRHAG